jgi:predicted Zn-dependent peptidase
MKVRICLLAIAFVTALAFSAVAQEVDRSQRPTPGPTPTLTLPEIEEFRLDNGLTVLLVEHHELPLLQARLIIETGSAADGDKPGLASFTADMLDEGTAKRSALQLAEEVDFIGAQLSTGSNWDGSYVTLLTLKRHLDTAFDLFSDIVLNPAFPEEELERRRSSRLTSILQQKDQPRIVATMVFNRVIYGPTHPYGQPASGTEESIRSIQRDDLKRFYETYYRPNNATLILVGDVTKEEIAPKVKQFFVAWTKKEVPSVKIPQAASRTSTGIYLVDKPEAAQSEIRIGHVGVARNNPDYFKLTVMNTILGGQFSSRINMNLREKRGYTYGARSSYAMRKAAGPFIASAGVKTAVTDSSVIEFMKELTRIRQEGVTAEELEFAKQSLLRRLPRQFETAADIARQLTNLVLYDLPKDYFNKYVQRIQAVTAEDVLQAARNYIHPDRSAIVIVGDVAKIREGLEALGYGPVVLLDSEGEPMAQK